MKKTILVAVCMAFLALSGTRAGAAEASDNFIKAGELHQQMQNDPRLFVFDVRTEGEYARGHIEGAHSLPLNEISQARLDQVDGLQRDSNIVTYCGCPHHLSGLAAQQLRAMDYRNVRVLEEGFWYWKENNYPVLPASSSVEISEMTVSGKLVADNKPVGNIDIFLKHVGSGQLEATRTDENGNYSMEMRLYDYQDNDQFEIFVANLDSAPIRRLVPGMRDESDVVIHY